MANGEYKLTNDGEYVIDDTPDVKLEYCPKCNSTDIGWYSDVSETKYYHQSDSRYG